MAQEKLLLLLMILVVAFAGSFLAAYGGDKLAEEEKWAKELSKQAMELNLQQLNNLLADKAIRGEAADKLRQLANNGTNDSNRSNSGVMVFVSSSMPVSLLRQYAREAEKFGAALIFKGLPSGSFKELAKLVMAVQEERSECPMQIDDEAFARYGVTRVPAIVRVREQYCELGQSCAAVFDKVVGSISIKAALAIMSQDSDYQGVRQPMVEQKQ